MHSGIRGLIPLVLALLPGVAGAQTGVGIAAEARAGWAFPAGDFEGGASGFAAEAGPTFAIGGRINFTPTLGIYAAYQQTRFGCEQCEALELDGATVLDGLEAGLQISAPSLGFSPWLRAGILQQQLSFSGFGERLVSGSATGFSGALGLAIGLSPGFQLRPGVSFLSVPAEFQFETVPDRSVDVTAFTIDLGVAYRF